MTGSRTLLVTGVIVLAALLFAPGATAFVDGFTGDADGSATDDTESNATMGAEVSTFMQSTATDANMSVDDGLFEAAYERGNAETRAAIVSERTATLEKRLDRLEAEQAALEEDEELNEAARQARLARLAVQIDALDRGIDDAEPRAAETGVGTAKLDELRANASSLGGPEVAAVAQGLQGIEPPRGPPEEHPGAGNDSDRGANGPGNAGEGPGAGTDTPGQGQAGAENDTDRGTAADPGADRGSSGSNDSAADVGENRGDEDRSPGGNESADDSTGERPGVAGPFE